MNLKPAECKLISVALLLVGSFTSNFKREAFKGHHNFREHFRELENAVMSNVHILLRRLELMSADLQNQK